MAPEVASTRRAPLEIVRLRHWGRWVSAVVILGLLVAAFVVLSQAQMKWSSVPDFVIYSRDARRVVEHRAAPPVIAQTVAIVIGIVIALMRRSANPVAKWFSATGYISLFRGLPVLLQILIWYNLALVIPTISIPLPFGGYLLNEPTNVLVSAFTAALLGLALNESAYMAEIVRAGSNSLDGGQTEAAKSIGMSPGLTLRRVVLPQAMRVIIPPTGNDFIDMLHRHLHRVGDRRDRTAARVEQHLLPQPAGHGDAVRRGDLVHAGGDDRRRRSSTTWNAPSVPPSAASPRRRQSALRAIPLTRGARV